MKRLLQTLFVTTALLGASLVASTTVNAVTHTVNPGESVQDAVDTADPGDTIELTAGTFDESITVDKPLIIAGAPGHASTIASVGNTITVTSSDVVISGLTIEAGDRGIVVPAGVDAENLHVLDNIIQHTDFGLRAETGGEISGLRVTGNIFRENNSPGSFTSIYMPNRTGDDIEVSNNQFVDNVYTAAAINLGNSLSNVRVLNNTVANDGGTFLVIREATGVLVSGNTVTSSFSGMSIGRGVSDMEITNNTFDGLDFGITFTSNLSPSAPATTDVAIHGNTFTNIAETPSVGFGSAAIHIGTNAYEGTLLLYDNIISGNEAGIINLDNSVVVNANGNHWGCSTGPNTDGCDTIEGSVTADIWYLTADMTATNQDPEIPDENEGTTPGGEGDEGQAGSGGLAETGMPLYVFVSLAALVVLGSTGYLLHRYRFNS